MRSNQAALDLSRAFFYFDEEHKSEETGTFEGMDVKQHKR